MAVFQKYGGAPWLYSHSTSDIVGLKDPDGSEFFFSRAGNYGLFRDMSDQLASVNTPTAIEFDTTLISNGVSIQDTNKIVVARGGKFHFSLTAQLFNTHSQSHNFYVWGRLNNVNLDQTLTRVSVTPSHGGLAGAVVLEHTYFAALNDGDYIQVMWMTDNAGVSIQHSDAVVGPPALPSSPSVSLSVFEFAA
jgi:hypothetical protein